MKHDIQLRVNGELRGMAVEPNGTLLNVLLEDFRLTRTKEGCSVGECGACTVSIDGKLVNSCLVLAVDADGKDIVTMEKSTTGDPGFSSKMEAFIHPDEGARQANFGVVGTTSTEVFTFCHLCATHCSMKAIVQDGKLVDLEPDMESGLHAEQCAVNKGRFTIPEVMGHKDRLLYPQKRAGARGEGKWQRISWDEALDTIAEKFNALKQEFGPESVAFGLGEPKGLEFAFAQRLASAFGTPTVVTPGWSCGVPKAMAAAFTYGAGAVCDDSKTPALLVTWGVNMAHTTGGLRRETLERILESGGKLIAVDPQKTYVAKLADLWIKLRPGSDGALAAGLLKVIVEEKLYDEEIVADWSVGFDKLQAHVATYSLEEIEKLTWVPPHQIEQFARMYRQIRPAAIHIGNAVEQHINSFQTVRAICIMRGICGSLNVPGGDVYLTAPAYTRPGNFFLLHKYPRRAERILGKRFKFAERSAFIPPHILTRAIIEADPCPVKAAMFMLSNPLVSWPNSKETYQALMKLEFIVTSDLFMTPTAALADIVLPAAWGMEHEELGYWPGWHEEIRAYPKLVEPPGECWPDTKIVNELAKRLGLAEDFWDDDHDALDEMLKPSGTSYDKFKGRRVMKPTAEYRPHDYRTPSKKIEIYSERLEKTGYAPMPLWEELKLAPEIPHDYPLLLTNGKEETYMLSGFKQIASVRIIRPDPMVEVHPDTAAKYGLEEGQWVFIETKEGKIKQRLSLNRSLDPRVVVAAFGWWFPEQAESGYGWSGSNINMLTPSGPDYDPSTGGVSLRGLACRISGT
ncbi:MAG: molybdopterin-dependent oxidoreductase [Deltaproteobacteria bacterium]|nr:molybdopterin-dependent oxidoreductase [Deltaproteobacteria bacterium]